jgi:hypothetical protein
MGWHASQPEVPFGGIGNPVRGHYHGEEGFPEPSDARAVFRRRRGSPTQLFHLPCGSLGQHLAMKCFPGDADPSLGGKPGR